VGGSLPPLVAIFNTKSNTMKKEQFSKELYQFICEYYHALLDEYQRLTMEERSKMPFPAFCVVFWLELTSKQN
jgi:hypothetical protein